MDCADAGGERADQCDGAAPRHQSSSSPRHSGHALRRPALVPAPTFAIKLLLGEFAESIVTGQRVIPTRAQALGYHFRYPELDIAFRGIFGE